MVKAKSAKSGKWLSQMEEFFKACADQTRLRILNMLAGKEEVCVCHLVDVLKTNQPKVSRHLAYLKRAGLVTDRKDGLWVYYRLASPLAEHAERLLACLSSCCAEVPELQHDVMNLEMVCGGEQLVKLVPHGRARALEQAQQAEVLSEVHPAPEEEIQIELL